MTDKAGCEPFCCGLANPYETIRLYCAAAGGIVRSVAIAISIGLILSGCWSEQDVTGPANKCVTDTYPSYSVKNLKQCVDVCIKRERGTTTTCSTSCTLRARARRLAGQCGNFVGHFAFAA
jgi:hypothetical protein